jgi:hypothetical protein
VETAWVQIFTLVGVLFGAAASFFSTRFIERERRSHEHQSRLDSRRLDVYASFSDAIKEFIQIAQRLAANRGLGTGQRIAQEEGLELLAATETRLGMKWESVQLVGDPATVDAARQWRHAAWHIEWFGRGLRSGPAEYQAAMIEVGNARSAFYERARRDLGIPGALPRSQWPPAWRQTGRDEGGDPEA